MDITQKLSRHVFGVSKEDNDVVLNIDIERDEDGAAVDTQNTAEASMLEAQEIGNEVAESDGVADEIGEAQGSLESLMVAVENFKVNGAMTPAVATAIYAGLDAITSTRFGITTEDYAVATLESFTSKTSEDICISLEADIAMAVGEFASSGLDAVKNVFSNITKWYEVNITTIGRLTARAKVIEKAASKLQGAPKSAEPLDRFANSVGVSSGTVAQAAKNLAQYTNTALVGGKAPLNELIVDNILSKEDADESKAIRTIGAYLGKMATNKQLPGKFAGFSYPQLNPNSTLIQAISALGSVKPIKNTGGKAPAPASPDEIRQIVASVNQTLGIISAHKADVKGRNKAAEKYLANKKMMVGAAAIFTKRYNLIRYCLVSEYKLLDELVKTCKSLLDYTVASAKLYAGGESVE